MACLWKNGKELCRVSKTVKRYDEILQENQEITYTRALMENNYVLAKFKVKTIETGKTNAYPWKRKGKLKQGKTLEDFRKFYTINLLWKESKKW